MCQYISYVSHEGIELETKELIDALKSDKIKNLIEDKYKGAVVPIGGGFIPVVFNTEIIDEIFKVRNEDAFETSRDGSHDAFKRLTRELSPF